MSPPTPFADYVARCNPDDETKVFPCKPGRKDPLISGGFHAASNDPDQLKDWATEHPDANVGLDLASIGSWVLDVDPRNGGDATLAGLILANGDLPPTLTIKTPSGGLHHYFAGPPFPLQTAGRLGPGVDTRSPGKGYVLLPPSVVDGKAYEVIDHSDPAEAPAWLLQLLAAPVRKPAKAAPVREPARAAPGVELDERQNVAKAIRYLKDCKPAVEGEGGNAHTFATAAAQRDLGVSKAKCLELMKEHFNPRCVPPWDPDELEVVVGNAYNYAQNEAGFRS